MREQFDSLAQRIIYGIRLHYSDFAPLLLSTIPETAQLLWHEQLREIVETLYRNPGSLGLPTDGNGCLDYYEANQDHPITVKHYKQICRMLTRFYTVLLLAGLRGQTLGDRLYVPLAQIGYQKRAAFLSRIIRFLSQTGILAEYQDDALIFHSSRGPELLEGWSLLSKISAERGMAGNEGVMNLLFACCHYGGDASYFPERAELHCGLEPGFFTQHLAKYRQAGFSPRLTGGLTPGGFHISFRLDDGSSGFEILYEALRSRLFSFKAINSAGLRPMLKDYQQLPSHVQELLFHCAKRCAGCRGARAARCHCLIARDGQRAAICPYFQVGWRDGTSHSLMNTMLLFNRLQTQYAAK